MRQFFGKITIIFQANDTRLYFIYFLKFDSILHLHAVQQWSILGYCILQLCCIRIFLWLCYAIYFSNNATIFFFRITRLRFAIFLKNTSLWFIIKRANKAISAQDLARLGTTTHLS